MSFPQRVFRFVKKHVVFSTLLLFTVFLAACGGSGASNSAGSAGGITKSAPSNTGSAQGSRGSQQGSNDIPAQYLIKTLKVGMSVKDTTKAADALQSWITTTDTRATSAGINYDQIGDNLYNVSLTFSVQSTLYPQIERYLRDYATQNGGQLLSLTESVQDVTNDYVDTQSRLTNLRGEQSRLLTLLSHAQALGDIITIQDKLTDIEGQIETIEAHLKELSGQVSYYTVVITLQPLTTTQPPNPTPAAWSLGQTFHDAFVASLAFAQGLLTLLVWLLAYSFYIIPLVVLVWFVVRWRKRSLIAARATPKPASSVETPSTNV